MYEMNVKSVNLGGKLCETIEQCLSTTPVIALSPIPAYLLNPLQWRTLAPVVDQLSLRPAGLLQPGPQVVQHVVRDSDTEWLHVGGHGQHSFDNFCVGIRFLLAARKACRGIRSTSDPSTRP